jgi:hypothetical protein
MEVLEAVENEILESHAIVEHSKSPPSNWEAIIVYIC